MTGSWRSELWLWKTQTMKPRPARFVDNKLKQRVIQVCILHRSVSPRALITAPGCHSPFFRVASTWNSTSLLSPVWVWSCVCSSFVGGAGAFPTHVGAESQEKPGTVGGCSLVGLRRMSGRLQRRSFSRVELAFEF